MDKEDIQEFEEKVTEAFEELAENQKRLEPEFEKILLDNLWDLY